MRKPGESKKPEITIANPPFLSRLSIHIALVILISFICYANTLFNEFAFDDVIVITENKFTQKGLEGINKLFTHDFFYGYSGEENKLGGGRWRPLSLITFALEWEFFGKNAFVNHLVNILLYTFCGIGLLLLLRRYFLPGKTNLALFITLLFIVHPIHTEAVANIKSRDEILSFLFLCGTLYWGLRFMENKKIYFSLALSLVLFFLALLSKENGLTFIAILPLSFYFFSRQSLKRVFISTLPYLLVIGLYLFLRIYFVGFRTETVKDINISPLANADVEEWICTIIYSLGKYLQLLVFPHPLSCDYSHNEIPYKHFSDISVWISLVIHAALLVFAVVTLKSKNFFSWGIFFYLFSIFIVSNLVIDVGAIVGERFLFQASLGYVFVLGILLEKVYQQIPGPAVKKYAAAVFILFTGTASISKTISRNTDWENNTTLFLQDVKTSRNSLRTNNSAGASLIILAETEKDSIKRMELYRQAISCLERAHTISPSALDPVFNLGVAHFNSGNYPAAEKYWREVASKPNPYNMQANLGMLSNAYARQALNRVNIQKDVKGSIPWFKKSVELNPGQIESWYNLGGAYFTIAQYDSARYAWEQVLLLNPQHENAKQGLNALPK